MIVTTDDTYLLTITSTMTGINAYFVTDSRLLVESILDAFKHFFKSNKLDRFWTLMEYSNFRWFDDESSEIYYWRVNNAYGNVGILIDANTEESWLITHITEYKERF